MVTVYNKALDEQREAGIKEGKKKDKRLAIDKDK